MSGGHINRLQANGFLVGYQYPDYTEQTSMLTVIVGGLGYGRDDWQFGTCKR